MDFEIEREDVDGGIKKTVTATIRDSRTGKLIELIDTERRYNEEVTVVIGSKEDPDLMMTFTEAGSSFTTATGNYVLKEINLEESTVTVKKLGDDDNEPLYKVLRIEAPQPTNNPATTEPAPSIPNGSAFDTFFQ